MPTPCHQNRSPPSRINRQGHTHGRHGIRVQKIRHSRRPAQLIAGSPRRRPSSCCRLIPPRKGGSTAVGACRPLGTITVAQHIHESPTIIMEPDLFPIIRQLPRPRTQRRGSRHPGRILRHHQKPTPTNHRPRRKSIVNSTPQLPARDIDVHPVQTPQLNPLRLRRLARRMILDFINDYSAVIGTENRRSRKERRSGNMRVVHGRIRGLSTPDIPDPSTPTQDSSSQRAR